MNQARIDIDKFYRERYADYRPPIVYGAAEDFADALARSDSLAPLTDDDNLHPLEPRASGCEHGCELHIGPWPWLLMLLAAEVVAVRMILRMYGWL